jgi:hypothetical protein
MVALGVRNWVVAGRVTVKTADRAKKTYCKSGMPERKNQDRY